MTHDESLAAAIRDLLVDEPDVIEKRMFGGQAFLIGGNMAVAANSRGDLMVRIDPARADELTQDPRASRMVMRGRELDGWLNVRIEGNGDTADRDSADASDGAVGITGSTGSTDSELARWVRVGVEYAASLPPK